MLTHENCLASLNQASAHLLPLAGGRDELGVSLRLDIKIILAFNCPSSIAIPNLGVQSDL